MPQLAKVLTTDDLNRREAGGGLDLTPYSALLDTVRKQGGVGATVTLGEGESQRTEKRPLSLAAEQRGLDLV